MKALIRYIFVISLLSGISFTGAAFAQSSSLQLGTRYRSASKSLTFTVRNRLSSRTCRYELIGSSSRRRLERPNSRNKKIASVQSGKQTTRIKASEVSEIRGNGSSKKVYFRVIATCRNQRRNTNISEVRIPTTQLSSLSASDWFNDLRLKFIQNTVSLTKAFPALSFNDPVDLQSPIDSRDRIFVVEQGGTIQVFDNSNSTTNKTTFLDIKDRVLGGGERGLLGLAFHPQFQSNGYFYLNYTREPDGATVLSRYQVSQNDPNLADPASELILLVVDQPFANHNGGALAFGKDGFLYIALGDGGSGGDPQGHAQNLASLLGKILRIDVNSNSSAGNYRVPDDNPFVNTSGARGEIFALGFRNPWRISVDQTTGEIWAGDVGQSTLEEVDIVQRGGNYGWNIQEGSSCYSAASCDRSPFIQSVAEYGRSSGGSITGGYVYRGSSVSNLVGSYLFADFISGRIFVLQRSGSAVEVNELFDSSLNISSFGQDKNNELYLLSYGEGAIYRFGQ